MTPSQSPSTIRTSSRSGRKPVATAKLEVIRQGVPTGEVHFLGEADLSFWREPARWLRQYKQLRFLRAEHKELIARG